MSKIILALYFLDLYGTIKGLSIVYSVTVFILLVVIGFVGKDMVKADFISEETVKRIHSHKKWGLMVFLVLLVLPSKDVVLLQTGYVFSKEIISEYNNTEEFGKLKELINLKIDQSLTEAKSKK